MKRFTIEEVEKNGFLHYETSNFGREGFFSKHNTSYWKGIAYLGFGPSAHSFVGSIRSWNVANNTKYIKAIQKKELPSEKEVLTKMDRFNEYIMTGLRTIWGVDLNRVTSEFGEEYHDYLIENMTVFVNQKLIAVDNGILKTTQKGKFLADGIASDLFMI